MNKPVAATKRLTYVKTWEAHDAVQSLRVAVSAPGRPEHATTTEADRQLQYAVEALRCALRSMEHGGVEVEADPSMPTDDPRDVGTSYAVRRDAQRQQRQRKAT